MIRPAAIHAGGAGAIVIKKSPTWQPEQGMDVGIASDHRVVVGDEAAQAAP
jgi:hypothetical protein